jgi:hypothetical protein
MKYGAALGVDSRDVIQSKIDYLRCVPFDQVLIAVFNADGFLPRINSFDDGRGDNTIDPRGRTASDENSNSSVSVRHPSVSRLSEATYIVCVQSFLFCSQEYSNGDDYAWEFMISKV